MVHVFTLEPLWLFSCADGRHDFPNFGDGSCAAVPLPVPGVSKEAIWCVVYRPGLPSLALCAPQLVIIHHRSGHLLLTLGPRIS